MIFDSCSLVAFSTPCVPRHFRAFSGRLSIAHRIAINIGRCHPNLWPVSCVGETRARQPLRAAHGLRLLPLNTPHTDTPWSDYYSHVLAPRPNTDGRWRCIGNWHN